jgi:hypothetical protein
MRLIRIFGYLTLWVFVIFLARHKPTQEYKPVSFPNRAFQQHAFYASEVTLKSDGGMYRVSVDAMFGLNGEPSIIKIHAISENGKYAEVHSRSDIQRGTLDYEFCTLRQLVESELACQGHPDDGRGKAWIDEVSASVLKEELILVPPRTSEWENVNETIKKSMIVRWKKEHSPK